MEEAALTVLYPLGLLLMAEVALMSQVTLQFARWLILVHSKWRGRGGQNGVIKQNE